ncbi:hypothetical protein [Gordonia sp. (in: high G+C Gram-positive bacteria)]|uniref:hypothetical protein n=1 Tax=Gordonia sp. (in: high G+C Gram-positive bacteria) TaxID=84139 RepID=UPI003C70D2AB
MKKAMLILVAAVVSATGCGSSDDTAADSPTTTESTVPTTTSATHVPGVFCRGTDVTIGGDYYVHVSNVQSPDNLGVCTTLESVSYEEWSSLDLNRQCSLASDKLISQHHGIVTYYGLISDPQSLDSALSICQQAGGEVSPTRK